MSDQANVVPKKEEEKEYVFVKEEEGEYVRVDGRTIKLASVPRPAERLRIANHSGTDRLTVMKLDANDVERTRAEMEYMFKRDSGKAEYDLRKAANEARLAAGIILPEITTLAIEPPNPRYKYPWNGVGVKPPDENMSFFTNPPHQHISPKRWAEMGQALSDSVNPAKKQADERAERALKRARTR
jgi:hypothetical protein